MTMLLMNSWLLLAAALSLEIEGYLKFLSDHPSLAVKGDAKRGEIELILDPEAIGRCQETQTARWVRKGFSTNEARSFCQVGIVAEDPYWIWLRDPVLFPNGAAGTYERLLWKSELQGVGGVAVLPVAPDGRILLNLNYRHATRSWEWELPRGGVRGGESGEEAALRELSEETGWKGKNVRYLGTMTPDSGTLTTEAPIYSCELEVRGEADPEYSEAIHGAYLFSMDAIRKGLKEGKLNGIPIRDSFLTFALYQMQNRSMKERPRVGVGVIVVKEGKVLLGKRRSAHGEGTWGFPGGHLELGETPEECAIRELFEETGLKALSVRKHDWTNDLFSQEMHYITLMMLVEAAEGELTVKEPDKCEKWEWHSWDALPEPLFLPIINLKNQEISK